MKLVVQKWEESERGWGSRPDGYTLHLLREHIALFVDDMRVREMKGKPKGYVPDEYSRPDGKPYEVEVADEELIEKVKASKHGCWGPGRSPPTPPKGVNPGGWTPMPATKPKAQKVTDPAEERCDQCGYPRAAFQKPEDKRCPMSYHDRISCDGTLVKVEPKKPKEPKTEPIPDYGDHMTMADFKESCEDGGISDDDGEGNYATADLMFKKSVNIDHVVEGKVDPKYTHVVWFNK